MSVHEQRREMTAENIMKSMGVKPRPGVAYVHLENTGNPADLNRQQNLYWQDHYEKEAEDESGIVMRTSIEQAQANEARYQRESESRLRRAPAAGLDKSDRETPGTVEYGKQVTVKEFLEDPDIEGE